MKVRGLPLGGAVDFELGHARQLGARWAEETLDVARAEPVPVSASRSDYAAAYNSTSGAPTSPTDGVALAYGRCWAEARSITHRIAGTGTTGGAFAFINGATNYAPEILNAAKRFDVDPWVLAIIMYRESLGGDALKPQGPTGTGDFIPRKPGNLYYKHADPNTGLPPDGRGWGRGLMQIDYGVHIDWFKTGANWQDAQTNINKSAEVVREKLRFFSAPSSGKPIAVESWRLTTGKPEYRIQPWMTKYPRSGQWPTSVPDIRPLKGQALFEAAIAAYNVSYGGVQQAIGLGLPAEAGTSGQDYVSSFLTRLASWQKNFK